MGGFISTSSLLLLCAFLFFLSSPVTATSQRAIDDMKNEVRRAPSSMLRDLPKLVTAPRPLDLSACPTLPIPPDSNNVNNLRPGNIKVVMAMGDSITAGMSAKDTSIFSMKEYRGLAYSIGGDSGITTMPNILKYYTDTGFPIGLSTGIGERNMATNGLNAAVSGAINIDMVSQANWLVSQLKANNKIDFDNDWKLLTMWIGSNNLCDVCGDDANNNAANFEKYVTQALEILYSQVPRVFVNLILNLDITQLDDINSGMCGTLHGIACSCVVSDRQEVYGNNLEYQTMAYTIAQKFSSRNNPEFTVVVQPFLEQTEINLRNELSAADCFHPSALSHAVASVALWNNMISPQSQKQRAWSFTDTPICATEDTLLYTN